MKIGDKVYCIKDNYISSDIPGIPGDRSNLKGEVYRISWINQNVGIAFVSANGGVCEYWTDPIFEAKNIFKDYFITMKEYRKLKLEKINDNRE